MPPGVTADEGPHDVATCPCCGAVIGYLQDQADALTRPEESPYRLAINLTTDAIRRGKHLTPPAD